MGKVCPQSHRCTRYSCLHFRTKLHLLTLNVHYFRMLQPQSSAGSDCVTGAREHSLFTPNCILFLNEFFIVSNSFFVFMFVFVLIKVRVGRDVSISVE